MMADLTLSREHKERLGALLERMTDAATNWLASLSNDQRRKAVFPFQEDDQRTLWYYTPTEQGGLPLIEMDPIQQRLAHRLIATGLSGPGYVTAATIMGLENILDAREGWKAVYPGRATPNRGRDSLLYFVSIFGEPGAKLWGWRLGGHHLSISHTIVDGLIASPTPLFFGANPAESSFVGPGRLRPLAGEEDLGRELLHALNAEQRRVALLTDVAPTDIVQSNRPRVEVGALPKSATRLFGRTVPNSDVHAFLQTDGPEEEHALVEPHHEAVRYELTPKGVPATALSIGQREILIALLRQYVDRLPEELAEIYRSRVTESVLDAIHFAWAGGSEPGDKHYYRLQGPRLLIEYDNTQNDANHIHAVCRDPEGDFGVDLLAEHYRHAH